MAAHQTVYLVLILLQILTKFCNCEEKETKREILRRLDSYLDDIMLKRVYESIHKDDPIASKCVDNNDNCNAWKAAGGCAHKDLMRIYCPKSCDLCKQPAPPIPDVPDCAKTQFGCCWDNATIAKGPIELGLAKSGCLPCLNRQSKTFCNNWRDDCPSKVIGQGDFMRLHCPQTCEVPCDYNMNINKCRDDPAHLQNCFEWFDDGKCTTEQAKMRVFCRSTCNFCQKS